MRFKFPHLLAAVLTLAAIVYLALNSGIEAQRYFNYGVRCYRDAKFDAASTYFRRAADLSPNPITAYNLALASWATVRDATELGENKGREVSREEVEKKIRAAHEAIGEALSMKLDDEQVLNLIYLEGRLLAVEGRPEEARSRLRDALSLEKTFKPALRELVRLDASGDPLQELVLNLAKDDEPEIVAEYHYR